MCMPVSSEAWSTLLLPGEGTRGRGEEEGVLLSSLTSACYGLGAACLPGSTVSRQAGSPPTHQSTSVSLQLPGRGKGF